MIHKVDEASLSYWILSQLSLPMAGAMSSSTKI